jgi:hypothetical protein
LIRGIRARLTVTLVALVALTAVLLGAGAYLFVENGLRSQVVNDAAAQARFDLAVIIPDRDLPESPSREDVVDSGLRETFRERGVETIVDLGPAGVVISNNDLEGALAALPADLRTRVDRGELAYAWTTVAGTPSLVVGGRVGRTGPACARGRDAHPDRACAARRAGRRSRRACAGGGRRTSRGADRAG